MIGEGPRRGDGRAFDAKLTFAIGGKSVAELRRRIVAGEFNRDGVAAIAIMPRAFGEIGAAQTAAGGSSRT